MENNNTEAQAVANIVQKPFIQNQSGTPIAFVPDGEGSWTHVDLSHLLPAPTRKKGTATLHEVQSFIDVVKRNGSIGNAVIYIDADYANNKVQATAVFNDHGDEGKEAGWRDHRAVFSPRQTKEWTEWLSMNGRKLSQVDLANFFESNISDFAIAERKPTGAEVLTFVASLQETRTVRYGSAINLQNGTVQLEFTEEGDAGQKGKLELFKEFALGIAPFFGGAAYKINAFLRYRIDRNTAQIAFWYELQKPEKALEDACSEIIQQIKDQTGVVVVFGSP